MVGSNNCRREGFASLRRRHFSYGRIVFQQHLHRPGGDAGIVQQLIEQLSQLHAILRRHAAQGIQQMILYGLRGSGRQLSTGFG
jgi:hypothetical protein